MTVIGNSFFQVNYLTTISHQQLLTSKFDRDRLNNEKKNCSAATRRRIEFNNTLS